MSHTYRYNRDNATRMAGTTTLKDAIGQLLKTYQLQTRFNETYLEAFWGRMMGPAIASRTNRLYVRDRKLHIEIASAPLRNELVNAKQKLIQLVNKDMGSDVIDDVIFI
ncbi:DciA family protein [Spirosoma knui]